MHLEIITPDSKIFTGEAEAVQFPGLDGSFQVLNNHASIISGLSEGMVKVDLTAPFVRSELTNESIQSGDNAKTILIPIKGGVVEMLNNKIIVLAE